MADLLQEPTPATLKRQLTDEDIVCPAGRVVGDASCFCSLEGGTIDGRRNVASLASWCMGAHTECPTWRAEKERQWEGKKKSLLERPDVRRTPQALRQQRLQEAQERLMSNSKEGRRFRYRLGLPEVL